MEALRQKLLVLYLGGSSPDAGVVAWSEYDGSCQDGFEHRGETEPPYASALAAMRDGWRVIKYPSLDQASEGTEWDVDYLKHEFVLEKLVTINVEEQAHAS